MKKFVVPLVVFLMFIAIESISAIELSQPKYAVVEELDVKVPMRDGILLSTNIYRPKEPEVTPSSCGALPMETAAPGIKAPISSPSGDTYM